MRDNTTMSIMEDINNNPKAREMLESLLEQHTQDDEITIPSLIDSLPLLKIQENIDFPKIIKGQIDEIKAKLREWNGATVASRRAVTFLIPLTSYLPLPKPYTAAAIDGESLKRNKLGRFTCVRIDDFFPRLGQNDGLTLKLSYALVTICDTSLGSINPKIENNKHLLKIYEEAIQALNKVIDSYKATPMRHNHLLQPITVLGSPGTVYIAVSNTKYGNVVSQYEVNIHEHLIGEIFAARNMADDELSIFQEIHVKNSFGNGYPLKMVKKLNEAIDARCMGRNEAAILLADLYAEHAMSYWLYRVLMEKGHSEAEAKKGSRGFKEITKLKNGLAKELEIEKADFDKLIKYNRWYQLCREKRNGLTHDFLYIADDPYRISYNAVQESASLIKRIAEKAAEKHPGLYSDGQIFWASTWILEKIKHQPWEK